MTLGNQFLLEGIFSGKKNKTVIGAIKFLLSSKREKQFVLRKKINVGSKAWKCHDNSLQQLLISFWKKEQIGLSLTFKAENGMM